MAVASSLGNAGPDWRVKASGDYNVDGFADILWPNSSGDVVVGM